MMNKMLKSLALLASAAMVSAESTSITSMFFLDADPKDPVSMGARLLGSERGITSYTLYCPDDVPKTECGLAIVEGGGMTYVNNAPDGGVTLIGGTGEDPIYTRSIACEIEVDTGSHTSTDAECTASYVAENGTVSGGRDFSTSYHDVTYLPVTVNAGSVTATSTASTSTSTSEASSSATESGSDSASEPAGTEATPTEPTPTPTGAASRVIGARGLVFGGFVMAMWAAL
ncbi:hypothetical protein BDV18DRAFT_146942 [Aspergillus unguis]